MPPSAWDDEDESSSSSGADSPVLTGRRKFDDEEDDVLDSWDAAEDSEVEREKEKKAAEVKAKADAEAAANKKTKAERIEEQRQARLRARQEEEDFESDDEDDTTKRMRLRAEEQDGDLKHAQDLFDDIGINPNRAKGKPVVLSSGADPTQAIDLSALPLFNPKTKDQFATLTSTLIPLLTANSKKPHYTLWLTEFSKQLVKELSSADVKKIASGLTTVSNEKMKEEKAAEKGGKKSKAAKTKVALVATRDVGMRADTTSYDDDGLGDDDFM